MTQSILKEIKVTFSQNVSYGWFYVENSQGHIYSKSLYFANNDYRLFYLKYCNMHDNSGNNNRKVACIHLDFVSL